MPHLVVRQKWTESERGWGQRPDGYTLHLSVEDRDDFIRRHREEEQRRNPSGEVPDCYSFADGDPQPVDVTDEVWALLLEYRRNGKVGVWETSL